MRATKADWQAAAEYLANHLIGTGAGEDAEAYSAAHLLWLYSEKVDFYGQGPRPPCLCAAEAIRHALAMRSEAFRAAVDAYLESQRGKWQDERNKLYERMHQRRAEREAATV